MLPHSCRAARRVGGHQTDPADRPRIRPPPSLEVIVQFCRFPAMCPPRYLARLGFVFQMEMPMTIWTPCSEGLLGAKGAQFPMPPTRMQNESSDARWKAVSRHATETYEVRIR